MRICQLDASYRGSVDAYIKHLWGGPISVTLGRAWDTSRLPGFVAEEDGALLGALLYAIDGDACEVSALFTLVQGNGFGTLLLDQIRAYARLQGLKRLWLVTTNDKTAAIRFYQKYGFSLKAIHIGSFDAVRRIKGERSERGIDGIPIEHEVEFEMMLS